MGCVLVTGGNGFLGAYCLPRLARAGFTVHAVSRERQGPSPDGVLWHRADLLAGPIDVLVQRIRPSHVLHLAWYTEHGRFWTHEENLSWLQASLGLLGAFRRAGGRRFVFAGSCAEYDWGFATCIEGKTLESPATLYGTCKKAFSEALFAYASQTGMSAAAGRIFLLYGPGEPATRLVPSVARALLAGAPVQLTDGEQVRDFLFVDDVAAALVRLLSSEVQGAVNIGSGQAVKIRDVVAEISRILGIPGDIRFGAVPRGRGDPDVLLPDLTRLHGEVGFCQERSLSEGLRATLEWIGKRH